MVQQLVLFDIAEVELLVGVSSSRDSESFQFKEGPGFVGSQSTIFGSKEGNRFLFIDNFELPPVKTPVTICRGKSFPRKRDFLAGSEGEEFVSERHHLDSVEATKLRISDLNSVPFVSIHKTDHLRCRVDSGLCSAVWASLKFCHPSYGNLRKCQVLFWVVSKENAVAKMAETKRLNQVRASNTSPISVLASGEMMKAGINREAIIPVAKNANHHLNRVVINWSPWMDANHRPST